MKPAPPVIKIFDFIVVFLRAAAALGLRSAMLGQTRVRDLPDDRLSTAWAELVVNFQQFINSMTTGMAGSDSFQSVRGQVRGQIFTVQDSEKMLLHLLTVPRDQIILSGR